MSNDLERSKDLFGNILAIQVISDLLKGDLRVLVRFLSRGRRIQRLNWIVSDSKSVYLGIPVKALHRTKGSLGMLAQCRPK